MKERVLETPYGYSHVVRYRDGYFWVDLTIRFDRKRIKRVRPIRGVEERPLMRRVVIR